MKENNLSSAENLLSSLNEKENINDYLYLKSYLLFLKGNYNEALLLIEELLKKSQTIKNYNLLLQISKKNNLQNHKLSDIKNKISELKKLGKSLYEEFNFSTKELNRINVFPRTRYLAYKLFYLYTSNSTLKLEKHIEWLLAYAEKSKQGLSINEQRILFYVLADAFCSCPFISNEKQESLKNIFVDVYKLMPANLASLPLKKALPYLDQNAKNIWRIF